MSSTSGMDLASSLRRFVRLTTSCHLMMDGSYCFEMRRQASIARKLPDGIMKGLLLANFSVERIAAVGTHLQIRASAATPVAHLTVGHNTNE